MANFKDIYGNTRNLNISALSSHEIPEFKFVKQKSFNIYVLRRATDDIPAATSPHLKTILRQI